MKMVYGVNDKPKFGKLVIFAFQQLLAIMAATIAVPAIINSNMGVDMSASAALFGAGAGTIIYQLFTKFKSPVFLGSSFAFIGSMCAAFAGAASASIGYLGIIIGAILAGLVYVIIAIIIKIAGVNWINKLMPPVVIGPTVALIGLSLAGAAVKDAVSYANTDSNGSFIMTSNAWASLVCALVTLLVVVLCSTYGKKMAKLIPFIIGILSGYAVAGVFTIIGFAAGKPSLIILDIAPFQALVENGLSLSTFLQIPDFTIVKGFGSIKDVDLTYIATVAVAYIPVAFVVFAEHIADHKNLSTIIEKDLLEEPGLSRTLLGDGVGSMVGAVFGGCPNTTYGESVGCVAITRNASVATITCTAVIALLISFISPFVAFLDSIPGCVMGGVCITLYGFIAVSGLKMIQKVDLEKSANLFTASVILITGIGGLALAIGKVTITAIATALILGIIVNIILTRKKEEEVTE
ncbi:MAG: uracil-xanthine permease [Clostridia bacterium]|nr:uracil-xanthine permease [Clostridia bacterium]